MMPQPFATLIPTPQQMKFALPSNNATSKAFRFEIQPELSMALTFPPQPLPPRPMKRRRPVADVDGEHSCVHKKKRRLRLFLITSRLSPQFSHPATNIVDRGNSKIAVWAKQKAMGRNLLHKAAILNRIRRRAIFAATTEASRLEKMIVSQDRAKEQLRLAALTLKYGSHDAITKAGLPLPPSLNHDANLVNDRKSLSRSPSRSISPSGSPSPELLPRDHDQTAEYRSPNDAYFDSPTSPRTRALGRSYLPLPPSPLGLSNYDAFDQEDDVPDPYAHLDDEYDTNDHGDIEQEGETNSFTLGPPSHPPPNRTPNTNMATSPVQSIYSDFSILDPDEPILGDYDRVDEGANPIWPTQLDSVQSRTTIPLSSSPDFPALFATSATSATPLPSTARVSRTSSSPNFAPSLSTAMSPHPSSPPPAPPPNMVATPISTSPTLAALPPVADETAPGSQVHQVNPLKREREMELEEERQRQKKLMFMRFGL